MLALPGHTSEQGTGNKPKNHLTQKLPYKSANFRYLSGTTCARGAGARDGTFGGGGRRVGGVPDSCRVLLAARRLNPDRPVGIKGQPCAADHPAEIHSKTALRRRGRRGKP